MGKAVIVFSFPEPEDRLEFGHILEAAKEVFIDRADLKVHAARADAAEKIMFFLETGLDPYEPAVEKNPGISPEEISGNKSEDWTFEFQPEHDGTVPLETAVFQALGAASVCWESMSGTGEFQSDRAKMIGEALLDRILSEYPNHDGSFTNLGPECFTNGTVISYKGENYYLACGTTVLTSISGAISSCVKRIDHPGNVHEDFDGNTYETEQ